MVARKNSKVLGEVKVQRGRARARRVNEEKEDSTTNQPLSGRDWMDSMSAARRKSQGRR